MPKSDYKEIIGTQKHTMEQINAYTNILMEAKMDQKPDWDSPQSYKDEATGKYVKFTKHHSLASDGEDEDVEDWRLYKGTCIDEDSFDRGQPRFTLFADPEDIDRAQQYMMKRVAAQKELREDGINSSTKASRLAFLEYLKFRFDCFGGVVQFTEDWCWSEIYNIGKAFANVFGETGTSADSDSTVLTLFLTHSLTHAHARTCTCLLPLIVFLSPLHIMLLLKRPASPAARMETTTRTTICSYA